MFKKMSIVLAAVATLGLAFAASAPASAQPVQHKQVNKKVVVHRNVQRNVQRNVVVNRNVNRNRFVVGHRYNGHIWYGRNRHFWHGRWYAYGIGPCWINVDGLWFWNVAACP